MDYPTFEKAMDRAGKALFLDNDTERCMKIMQSIIIKFDSIRKCGPRCSSISREESPSIQQRVACFAGAYCPGAAITVHISMARLWASAGEVKPLFTTLKQLLVVSFFWRLRKVMPLTPSNTPAAEPEMVTAPAGDFRPQLPAEIWREVASWLSRPDWKTLLLVPHPLRKFASDLFFRDIFLQFDVVHHRQNNPSLEELEAWHSKRALDIMTRIMRDWRFASRVRSLRVHMCDHRSSGSFDIMNFELNCLAETIRKMTKLKTLHLYGSPIFLYNLVASIPQLAPRLENLTVRYHTYGSQLYFPKIPTPLKHLQGLHIHPTTWNVCIYSADFQQLGQTIRRLRMTNRLTLVPIVSPLIENLTHLELISSWGAAGEASLLEVILGNGACLEALRLVGCPEQIHSIYFRQFPRSLPQLRIFGLHLSRGDRVVMDVDLFPAVCHFLRDRPLLETLELMAPAHAIGQVFGFGPNIWEFISTLDHLRILSTRLLNVIPSQTMVGLIPRTVQTLTVPYCGVHYLEQLLQKDNNWPDDLRLFGWHEYRDVSRSPISTAKKIAAGIHSLRVVRLANDYFTVMDREKDKSVRVEQWTSRAARVFRREFLESCGCEDFEYLDMDHDDILV